MMELCSKGDAEGYFRTWLLHFSNGINVQNG
jgi:hypothetical protein